MARDNKKDYKKLYGELVEELNELEEKLLHKEQECERLKDELSTYGATGICEVCTEKSILQNDRYRQTLAEIIRFFKEDENFARYSGRPIIFAKPALEKIEKILKENDIKIREVENE